MAGVYKAYASMASAVNTASGTVVIDNTVVVKDAQAVTDDAQDAVADASQSNGGFENSGRFSAEQEEELRRRMDEEIERVKCFYRDEGEKALAEAKQKAQSILKLTEDEAKEYAEQARQQAKKQAEEIFAKAREDGFAQGHEDGYKKGLLKCKDMLMELKQANERIISDRAELYDSYETEIFDTVMEIANRVTLDCLNQKDKALVRKTVKQAGKTFRGSDYVKISLAGTDICEELPADAEYMKKLLNGVKTVEVEVLKDAPSGTVILDNGSAITDAGIMTQLKMIEELGKGKYRRAPSARKRDGDNSGEAASQQQELAPEKFTQ